MSQITVLVAASVHAVSGKPIRSRGDAIAVALALGLKRPLHLLSAGQMPDSVARDYLALGAPSLELLDCDDNASSADVASVLLPSLRDVPWVLTGSRAATEAGSGVLPHVLALQLGRPLVTDVLALEPDGSGWIITQALPKGARRRLRVSAPAVLCISAAAAFTPGYSLAKAMAGQILRRPVTASLAASVPGQRVATSKRRKLLEARIQQSGHARMLGAIESPSTGGTVLSSGSAQSKAQAVLDYLRTHSLVPF